MACVTRTRSGGERMRMKECSMRDEKSETAKANLQKRRRRRRKEEGKNSQLYKWENGQERGDKQEEKEEGDIELHVRQDERRTGYKRCNNNRLLVSIQKRKLRLASVSARVGLRREKRKRGARIKKSKVPSCLGVTLTPCQSDKKIFTGQI